jgi:hypothetical protein
MIDLLPRVKITLKITPAINYVSLGPILGFGRDKARMAIKWLAAQGFIVPAFGAFYKRSPTRQICTNS